jgi:hypothetical protein
MKWDQWMKTFIFCTHAFLYIFSLFFLYFTTSISNLNISFRFHFCSIKHLCFDIIFHFRFCSVISFSFLLIFFVFIFVQTNFSFRFHFCLNEFFISFSFLHENDQTFDSWNLWYSDICEDSKTTSSSFIKRWQEFLLRHNMQETLIYLLRKIISSSVAARVMTTSSSRACRLLLASYDSRSSMIIILRLLLFRIHLRT